MHVPLPAPGSILNQVSLGRELAVLKLLCMFTGVEQIGRYFADNRNLQVSPCEERSSNKEKGGWVRMDPVMLELPCI